MRKCIPFKSSRWTRVRIGENRLKLIIQDGSFTKAISNYVVVFLSVWMVYHNDPLRFYITPQSLLLLLSSELIGFET